MSLGKSMPGENIANQSMLLQQLYKRVTMQTAAVWAHTLVLRLLESLKQDPSHDNTPRLDLEFATKRFTESKKRLLMFDYGACLIKFQ